jgi:hypothetical protein
MNMTSEGLEFQNRYKYHSTEAIIKAIEEKSFPVNAMITFHPQRWSNKVFPWMKELLVQTVKNSVKYFIVKINQKLNFG